MAEETGRRWCRRTDSDFFEIKYSCNDPKNAALVVNEVTKQYLTAQEGGSRIAPQDIIAALTQEMESG